MIQKFIQKIILIAYTLGISVTITIAQNIPSPFEKKFYIETATAIIAIGNKISKEEIISEEEWKQLFETKGYKQYLNNRNGEKFQKHVKEALLLAFNSQKTTETDSILDLSAQESDILLILKQNIYRLARQQAKAKIFLEKTNFTILLEQAHKKVLTFLPKRAIKKQVALNDLYLICAFPDATVRNHSVFLDLNLSLSMTEKELIDLLAHEFFHNYRDLNYQNTSNDSFVKVFNMLQNEGIADFIDKENKNGYEIYATYDKTFGEIYEQAYQHTPKTLAKIDSLVKVYESGPPKEHLTSSGEYIPLADLIILKGHPIGFYMTNLIRKAGLFRALIRNFDNPIKFIQLYNRAAKQHNRTSLSQEYVLSQKLIKHLKKQQGKC